MDKSKIFLATFAEQVERYDDMAECMKDYMKSREAPGCIKFRKQIFYGDEAIVLEDRY